MQKTDLAKRLSFANEIEAPDDWSEVVRRAGLSSGGPAVESSRRRSVRIAIAFVVAALFAAAVGWAGVQLRNDRHREPAVTPTPVPTRFELPDDTIVFSNARGWGVRAEIELVAVSAAGGPTIPLPRLTGYRLSTDQPIWSPDGERLAFVGGPSKHILFGGNIYVVSADGSGLVQVTSGLDAALGSWSPDGTRLAFVENQGTAMAVVNADGTDRHVIARDRGFYQLPTWSPDGSVIAFRSGTTIGSERSSLFTIRPDGTGEQRLPLDSGGPLAWSPDGSRIAYGGRGGVLWVANADSSGAHRVTTGCTLPCRGEDEPTWSPDGTQIAFIQTEWRNDERGAYRLYVVDVATGVKRGLTPDLRFVGSPTWRPA